MTLTTTTVRRDKKISTFAEAETRLAESLPGYERRPQQQALARAVEATIAAGTGKPRTHLLAEAGCGCIYGDAQITVNRGGVGRPRKLSDLVDKFNGGGGRYSWNLSIPTYVQREVEGAVRLALLVNAWCSGVKQTYTVTTETGRTIRTTDEHPFLTERGWLRLDELVPGDEVHVRGGQVTKNVLYKVVSEQVVSVEPFGKEMTYDLEVEDDPHNFIVDGFVVHNTGKSLGYLIPAILSGERVLVSTATKALQDQIAGKDLPFLAENLGVPFSYAVLKGRSNYLCPVRLYEADPGDVPSRPAIVDFLEALEVEKDEPREAGETIPAFDFTGTREEFPFEILAGEWAKIASDSEECEGCKDSKPVRCFAELARKKARGANVVVVNHALYLTELMVKEATDGIASFLGEHDVVVFDEAHEIEDYASGVLGSTFKETGVRAMVAEANNFGRCYCGNQAGRIEDAGDVLLGAVTGLWAVLAPGRIRTATIIENADDFVAVANALGDFSSALSPTYLLDECSSAVLAKAKKQKKRLCARADNTFSRFSALVTDDFTDLVRWVEEETRKGIVRKVLKSAPVNVGLFLRANLFNVGTCRACGGDGTSEMGGGCKPCGGSGQTPQVTAILTSATMSVNGKMDYLCGRLGIDNHADLDVGSPFSFSTQSELYVPKHLPEPTPANRAAWSSMMVAETIDLVRASEGRALVLFTSVAQMRTTYEAVSSRVPFTCMIQGEAPNVELAARFAADVHSVLFATKSFMTGVDFQGEACSLVIIDKLPFSPPNDPVVEARCDALRAAGRSDFRDYTIPVMTLTLKQAFGRLIRHRNDTGVVAILDSRLLTKGYGRTILKSLPPAKRVEKIEELTFGVGV